MTGIGTRRSRDHQDDAACAPGPGQLEAITKRVKRAHGQMGAIVRMLEEGRSCEDIVTQMAAVAKAVNTAAFTLISASLKECIVDPKETPTTSCSGCRNSS